MRSRPGLWPPVAVGLTIAVSVAVRYWAAQRFVVPWIAPDEMLYGLLGTSLWEHGTLTIRGVASPYYSLLTPALVGAGLVARGAEGGVALAQLLQLVAMSSTAVPVYLWSRRVAAPWWSVAAAVIAISGPVLTYGGLLMTEALFYPACVWATFALAVALERPTIERQGLFLLAVTVALTVRLQAIVLLPSFALAAVLYARIEPGERRFRPLAPLALGVVAVTIGLGVVRLVDASLLGSSGLLGAYATLGESGAIGGGLAAALVGHVAAVALAACIVPAVATALIVVESLRGRVTSRPVQAFAATTAAFVPLLVVQVALFATDHLDHVSQRYLVTALPLAAVGLAAWAACGAPRPRGSVLVTGLCVLGAVALVSVDQLVPHTAMYDALSTAALGRLEQHPSIAHAAIVLLAALGVALVSFTPRRWIGALPVVTIAVMIVTGIEAGHVVERLSRSDDRAATGGVERDWVNRNAPGPVTLLVTGDRPWTAEARTVFWNSSVREVLALPAVGGGVPPSPTPVTFDPDNGSLRTADGAEVRRAVVAAPRTVALDGEEIAVMPVGDATSPALALWRVDGAVRVASRVTGVLPNGDFGGRAAVLVPGCVRGALEVTFIGKSGDPVRVTVNGAPRDPVDLPAGSTPTVSIPAPGYVDGAHACEFVLDTDGYVGTTRIAYVPVGT